MFHGLTSNFTFSQEGTAEGGKTPGLSCQVHLTSKFGTSKDPRFLTRHGWTLGPPN